MKIELDLKGFKKIVDVSPEVIYSEYFRYPVPQKRQQLTPYNTETQVEKLEIIDFRPDSFDGKWRPV